MTDLDSIPRTGLTNRQQVQDAARACALEMEIIRGRLRLNRADVARLEELNAELDRLRGLWTGTHPFDNGKETDDARP